MMNFFAEILQTFLNDSYIARCIFVNALFFIMVYHIYILCGNRHVFFIGKGFLKVAISAKCTGFWIVTKKYIKMHYICTDD